MLGIFARPANPIGPATAVKLNSTTCPAPCSDIPTTLGGVQVIFQHLSTAPVAPAQRAPGDPALASDLCLWMLAKDPADRPQNYEELRQAFRHYRALFA